MSTRNLTLIVILAALLIFGGCACSGYNGLVSRDENVKNAWNNVQTDYQRRSDLVPNLVNTVKGAANFEQQTLTNVVEARAHATEVKVDASNLTPEKLAEFQKAQGQLSGALGRLLAVAENYPTLKATANFQDLQRQLEGIENSIRNSRNNFNGAVNDYNVRVRSFPMNMLSGMFGFKPKTGFAADAGADKAPQVKF
jgi:LemA protein